MCVVAGAVGAVASGVGALSNAIGGGSGPSGGGAPAGAQTVYNPQSLGQTLSGILGGGVATSLGLSGLAGGNLNQLQAGAVAANPFGSQAPGYYNPLSALLGGGAGSIAALLGGNAAGQTSFLNQITPQATINTNPQALAGTANITTPGATGALSGLVSNPQSASLPGSISSILAQNPYAMNAGQQFQYQQGLGALQATQAAQGLIGSGNQLAALENYGQQAANTATQTNINAALGAEQANLGAFGAQTGAAGSLANILSQQQQNTFGNLYGIQQLQGQQGQQTFGNLSSLLTSMGGIGTNQISGLEGLLNPLLVATQASTSSPATAGGILSNLGASNVASGGLLSQGLGGLANGLGGAAGTALSGLFGGGGGSSFTGDFSTGLGTTTMDPFGGGSSYTYGGSNTYGFTMPGGF